MRGWKPEKGETYYSISEIGSIIETCDLLGIITETRGNFYNIFQTREGAKAEAEKILVRRQLEDIAKRLNKGKKFDWDDGYQCKWYISYNHFWGIKTYSVSENKTQGTIYCLAENFLDVTIQEIGEERLNKYLKRG